MTTPIMVEISVQPKRGIPRWEMISEHQYPAKVPCPYCDAPCGSPCRFAQTFIRGFHEARVNVSRGDLAAHPVVSERGLAERVADALLCAGLIVSKSDALAQHGRPTVNVDLVDHDDETGLEYTRTFFVKVKEV